MTKKKTIKPDKKSALPKKLSVGTPIKGHSVFDSIPIETPKGFHIAYVNPFASSHDDGLAEKFRDRLIACYNACAGIKDPATTIPAMIDALLCLHTDAEMALKDTWDRTDGGFEAQQFLIDRVFSQLDKKIIKHVDQD